MGSISDKDLIYKADLGAFKWDEAKKKANLSDFAGKKEANDAMQEAKDDLAKKKIKKPYVKVGFIGENLVLQVKCEGTFSNKKLSDDVVIAKNHKKTFNDAEGTRTDPEYQKRIAEYVKRYKAAETAMKAANVKLASAVKTIEGYLDVAKKKLEDARRAGEHGDMSAADIAMTYLNGGVGASETVLQGARKGWEDVFDECTWVRENSKPSGLKITREDFDKIPVKYIPFDEQGKECVRQIRHADALVGELRGIQSEGELATAFGEMKAAKLGKFADTLQQTVASLVQRAKIPTKRSFESWLHTTLPSMREAVENDTSVAGDMVIQLTTMWNEETGKQDEIQSLLKELARVTTGLKEIGNDAAEETRKKKLAITAAIGELTQRLNTQAAGYQGAKGATQTLLATLKQVAASNA